MVDKLELLTILNVNQAKPSKRQQSDLRDWHLAAKRARLGAATPAATNAATTKQSEAEAAAPVASTSANGGAGSSVAQALETGSDFWACNVRPGDGDDGRELLAQHAVSLVHKTRSRVIKNNEALAKVASGGGDLGDRDVRDQGFTRPKILVLLPFRQSALVWVQRIVGAARERHGAESALNLERFIAEYGLPDGVTDKLATDAGNSYPDDHRHTFKGNIDDSFRFSLKLTRKQTKLFTDFYSSDFIIASPLGLRKTIEKENDADYLSSIELLIADQLDVMLMQNWDHVSFVLARLNQMPRDSHGCDFSRVKPPYLDGHAAAHRHSFMISAYETPELRAMYNRELVNVAGKAKVGGEAGAQAMQVGLLGAVPRGVKQVFQRFDANDLQGEDDTRFSFFTDRTLPSLLKSATSSERTLVFVPSYFDFIRLRRHLSKQQQKSGSDEFSFAAISEYSSTSEVSRARAAFYAGRVKFLVITERFHFFHRYRIRGARTVVFYGLPEHAQFYPELINVSVHDVTEWDVSELSSVACFSRFDLLKLERIVGTTHARRMLGADDSRFTFA